MKQDTTEQLIIKNEGLVYYTLDLLNCKYSDEAISVGYEALWRAIETFDTSKNVKFSTYAVVCIRNAIWDMFRAQKEVSDNEIFFERPGGPHPELDAAEAVNTITYADNHVQVIVLYIATHVPQTFLFNCCKKCNS